MTPIATALKWLIAAGVTGEALVTAISEIEAEMPRDRPAVDEQAERRRAADRERKRLRNSAESAESAETPSPLVPPLSPAPLSPPIIPPTLQTHQNARDDAAEAVAEWNATAQDLGLPVVQRLTDVRRKKLRNRLKDCGGIDGWRAAMAKIRGSPLCRGEINDWRADFDFVLQESSFIKLMEGKYDGSPKVPKPNSLAAGIATVENAVEELIRREAQERDGSHEADYAPLPRLRQSFG